MNNKSTQILLIIGIVLIIGGAVYASLNLVKKQPGQQTNTTNTATVTSSTGTLLNLESNLKGNSTFTKSFFVPTTSLLRVPIIITSADISLVLPSGATINSSNVDSVGAEYTFDTDKSQAVFSIPDPLPGTWEIQLNSTIPDSQYFWIKAEATTTSTAVLSVTKQPTANGTDLLITATASDRGVPEPAARWTIAYGPYAGITPRDVTPLVVYDDGHNNDGVANDGVFGAKISTANISGKFYMEGDAVFPSGLNLNTVTLFEITAP